MSRTGWRGACAILAFLAGSTALQAQVVPDGTTSTTVHVGTDGTVRVGIAPSSRNGVSLNRYDDFNVRKPGVRLDNRVEGARTIVNEVTSTRRTTIEGPLEVLGQRAHVIVANPNGIVIDGGRFVNTGRVALTTGKIGTQDRQIAPGVFQENVTATVTGGTIHIGPGGLAGQMDAVDLIAHKIRVSGTVLNENPQEQASLGLVAGNSLSVFDSAIIPGNIDSTWRLSEGSGPTGTTPGVVIEIERAGVLRANRIGIEVNGKGVGVRFAGRGLAGARDFVLRSDGQVNMDGARINAKKGTVQITAGTAALQDTNITGRVLALNTTKGHLKTNQSKLVALPDPAIKDDSSGVISIASTGTQTLQDTRIDSSGIVIFTADRDLRFADSTITARLAVTGEAGKKLSFADSTMRATGNIVLAADEMAFHGQQRQSEVVAEGGSLMLATTGKTSGGDLVNRGALLQGGTRIDSLKGLDDSPARGAVTLNVAGDILNESTDQLSVFFGAGGNIDAQVKGDIDNLSGRFLSNKALKLSADGDLMNRIPLPVGTRAPLVTRETRDGSRVWWTLWTMRRQHHELTYDFGTVERPERLATLFAGGRMDLTAGGTVLNEGGSVGTAKGDLSIQADKVENASVQSGRVSITESCVIFCSHDGDSSDVLSFGGRIQAGRNLAVTAASAVLNEGGSIASARDMAIETPLMETRAAQIPIIAQRPAGLYNLWASRASMIFNRDQGGEVIAVGGALTVDSDAAVRIDGGRLDARDGLMLENGQEIVKRPEGATGAMDHEIGWLRRVPLLVRD